METAIRKTYAEFLLPDPDHPGDVIFSIREVPYGDRDPDVPPGRPAEAIGIRFYDQVTVEVADPKTSLPIRCTSSRIDIDPGVTFYGGMVLTETDLIDPSKTNIPRNTVINIVSVMRRNNWKKVIFFVDPRIALPYDEAHDRIYEA